MMRNQDEMLRMAKVNQQMEYSSILADQKAHFTQHPQIKLHNPGAGAIHPLSHSSQSAMGYGGKY
jgi:hypothetical protein